MGQREVLHFVDANVRMRAELARIAFAQGHHAEVYADLVELCEHPPQNGIVVVRASREDGWWDRSLELFERCGIWLPLVAMDEAPTTAQVVAAIKAGELDVRAIQEYG